MKPLSCPSEPPRGVALVFAMITLTVIAILAVALSSLAVSCNNSINDRKDLGQSLLLADTGVSLAAAQLSANFDLVINNGGKLPFAPFSNATSILWPQGSTSSSAVGVITVTLTYIDAGNVMVNSTGKVLNRNSLKNSGVQDNDREIHAAFVKGLPTGYFPVGAFGKLDLTAHGNIFTDSYRADRKDPSTGALMTYAQQVAAAPAIAAAYDAQGNLIHGAFAAGTQQAYDWSPLGDMGNIGSNGPLSTVGALTIYGSATPGVGQTVTGGGTITGSTAPELSPYPLPPVSYLPPAGLAVTSVSGTLDSGTYRFASWPSQNVTVTGKVIVYLDGNFDQNGQKSLTIAPGGSLIIYMGGSSTFTLNGGGIINQSTVPSNFNIISASTGAVKLSGGAVFYGGVYAPNADVTVTGNADSYGAVIGKTTDLGGTAAWHWDQSAQSPAFHFPVLLASWFEVDAVTHVPFQ